jgi:hypothetical protein
MVITVVILFYNKEWQKYHGMEEQKIYYFGPTIQLMESQMLD